MTQILYAKGQTLMTKVHSHETQSLDFVTSFDNWFWERLNSCVRTQAVRKKQPVSGRGPE